MSDYRQDLLADLQSESYAAKYLSAAARDSEESLLVALRDVAEAMKNSTFFLQEFPAILILPSGDIENPPAPAERHARNLGA